MTLDELLKQATTNNQQPTTNNQHMTTPTSTTPSHDKVLFYLRTTLLQAAHKLRQHGKHLCRSAALLRKVGADYDCDAVEIELDAIDKAVEAIEQHVGGIR
jgi:hypothetical protein